MIDAKHAPTSNRTGKINPSIFIGWYADARNSPQPPNYWYQIKLRGDYLPAKDSMTPQILHPQATAERIAADCTASDAEWTYTVKQFGKYFAVEISDQDGLIGYL
jgi:hypothetical protein